MLQGMFRLAYSKQKLLCRYYVRKARNPGIDRRAALLPDDAKPEEYAGLEDSESNFYDVHRSHKQYEAEQAQYRDRLQTWIVGNKYFKSKQLNFLSWSEKEQIRYLYGHDADEWTIDRLTESFPADRYTIAKIVKTKWQPKDEKRIERHDAVVKENWQMFCSGRIKHIDPGFAQHLKKFAQRNIFDGVPPRTPVKRVHELRPLPEGQFSAIITSCKTYQTRTAEDNESQQMLLDGSGQPDENVEQIELSSHAPKHDSFLMGDIQNTKLVTLSEMKRRSGLPTATNDGDGIDFQAPLALKPGFVDKLEKDRNESVMLTDSSYEARSAKKEDIKEFIQIPKKLYKKGATYQLDDCFYDDDGEFLYRVPGMTGHRKT
ncbi:uncharacterized protein LOC128274409 [Anopheles cruzii]|uniref:uncharacterized protein LOC128274409 n=1 Tax=Anopheles cruzii TaxID=68878 RepID=UPI0022EC73C5|nr:uncharacterized protein LOC128274409 [Anopheles cruzii]